MPRRSAPTLRAPASAAALARLREESRIELPSAYLHLLAQSDGGEWALRVPPGRFVLWPAREVVALNQRFEVDESYPGLFAFGSDGGATAFALDTRAEPPWPVVTAPFIGHDSEISVLAADFEAFRSLLGT